jgi:hypothetical protein
MAKHTYIHMCTDEAIANGWEKITDDSGKIRFENDQMEVWGFSSPRQLLLVLAERSFYDEKWEPCEVCIYMYAYMHACVYLCVYYKCGMATIFSPKVWFSASSIPFFAWCTGCCAGTG